MKSLRSALALLATLAAFLAAPASAGVVVFTDLAAFNAATVDDVTHDFEGIAPGGSFVYVPDGVVIDGISFDSAGNGFVIDADAGFGHYGVSFFSGQGQGSVVAVSVSGGTTAIGFFFGSYPVATASQAGTVLLNTGDVFDAITPVNAGSDVNFIGFVTDGELLTSIDFNVGNVVDITRFITARSASIGTVPEPASLALAGIALLGLGLMRRRVSR